VAYKPPRKPPQFADLVSVLAQSKSIDPALYQTIQEIINRLDQFITGESITSATQAAQGIIPGSDNGGGSGTGPQGPPGPPGPIQPLNETFITVNTEATLANHRRLVAGTNVTLNTATPGQIIVHAAGGSGGGPHAPTHEPGGIDPMTVDAIPTVGSLRTLGTGPNQAKPGNAGPGPHAITHSAGNIDPVTVTNLAGYPGGTVNFLRADGTFAPPPGGAGGGMNLDYLGDYVTSVYNDGDIVIGPDGIAYMCVVDGTTTPPEPWPGVGIAINPAVDATYWTVSPHPQLVNERALSLLANGYVKSTAGEPSTVAIIPVSEGGTGATTPSTARTNLGIGTVGPIDLNGDARYFLNGFGQWAIPQIPSGFIVLSAGPCPIGYTRVSQADGYFLVASPTWGSVGGANTHAHTLSGTVASHAHGLAAATMPVHSHGGAIGSSGTSGPAGGHSHGVTASGSGSTGNAQGGSSGADAGGSFTASATNHFHDFSVNVAGATDTVGDHSHSINVTGFIPNDGGQAIGGTTDAAAPGLTGATDVQSNVPVYWTTILCYKD